MKCDCGSKSEVISTQMVAGGTGVYRRRVCKICLKRFSTIELKKEYISNIMDDLTARRKGIETIMGEIDGRRRNNKRH